MRDNDTEYLVDVVHELNGDFILTTGEEEYCPFEYSSDGFVEIVRFSSVIVYNSEHDDPCKKQGCDSQTCSPVRPCEKRLKGIKAIVVDNQKRVTNAFAKWQALLK